MVLGHLLWTRTEVMVTARSSVSWDGGVKGVPLEDQRRDGLGPG